MTGHIASEAKRAGRSEAETLNTIIKMTGHMPSEAKRAGRSEAETLNTIIKR